MPGNRSQVRSFFQASASSDESRKSAKLVVGMWPVKLATNIYNEELCRQIAPDAEVVAIEADVRSALRVARRKIDVIHLHWLDRVLWGKKKRIGRAFRAMAMMALIIALTRLRGGRIIWTAHDPEPHDMAGTSLLAHRAVRVAWDLFRRYAARRIDGVIVMNESHVELLRRIYPCLKNRPFHVIPHPHYRGGYENGTSAKKARQKFGVGPANPVILFFGNIRPYKGLEALVDVFRDHDCPETNLIVAGKLNGSKHYNAAIVESLAREPRALAHFGVVPSSEIQHYFAAADIFIAPFPAVTNSGSVMLALSYDCPVLLPDKPVFRELRETVGSDWIRLFRAPITPGDIRDALLWARAEGRPSAPDLEPFGWPKIARQTISVYRMTVKGRADPAVADAPPTVP